MEIGRIIMRIKSMMMWRKNKTKKNWSTRKERNEYRGSVFKIHGLITFSRTFENLSI